jgi:branched-chain amino acid transport system substrate-binding protein
MTTSSHTPLPTNRINPIKRLFAGLLFSLCASLGAVAHAEAPIVIGITAEFGMQSSYSAQSIEKGIQLAIDEINTGGGVLGRKLALEKRDDRGVPARAIDNLNEFATRPDVVAFFCGRFSPVAIELAPAANKAGLVMLDPWAAADSITHHAQPDHANHVFRLSLTDTWALDTLLDHARSRRLSHLKLFVPNTAWGRSSEAALVAYTKRHSSIQHTTHWYNWGDVDFSDTLRQAKREGAQGIVMVANEPEGAIIVKQMAALPADLRLPILAHWGIAGGNFLALTGDALKATDLAVVQTFTFHGNHSAKIDAVAAGIKRLFGHEATAMYAQVGFAHAYDLTHLLAQAIKKAKSADRTQVRNALERIESHAGLVRSYQKPFSPTDHEALERSQLFMARYDKDGNLRAIGKD